MPVRTLLCHGCATTAPLAAVDAPWPMHTHGPLAPPERIKAMPFATRDACYVCHVEMASWMHHDASPHVPGHGDVVHHARDGSIHA